MKNVKVDELVFEGITYVPKESVKIESKVIELNGSECPYVVGQNYLIRTVTMIQVGKLERVTDKELILSDASWIADTGRFGQCLAKGTFDEVEKLPDSVIVSRGAIVDAHKFNHELPKETK